MIPRPLNQTIEHSAPCIELLTKRWLQADKPQADELSIKNYPSNWKFFGITCESGSQQEYLDRCHRIDSIEIAGRVIVRASVRRRGAATVAIRHCGEPLRRSNPGVACCGPWIASLRSQ